MTIAECVLRITYCVLRKPFAFCVLFASLRLDRRLSSVVCRPSSDYGVGLAGAPGAGAAVEVGVMKGKSIGEGG